MFTLLVWAVFGLIVGLIAKALHPGNTEPIGCLPTIGVGIAGSFVGGGLNWMLGFGSSPFAPAGFVMSVVGGILFLVAWRWWALKNDPEGPKAFFTGKKLR